jgi:hypothetical protein
LAIEQHAEANPTDHQIFLPWPPHLLLCVKNLVTRACSKNGHSQGVVVESGSKEEKKKDNLVSAPLQKNEKRSAFVDLLKAVTGENMANALPELP